MNKISIETKLDLLKKILKSTPYHKPEIKKQSGLKFTNQIWKALGADKSCMQCSSCHGCR